MDARPRLLEVRIPPSPQAAVLVLHGGASRGPSMMVSPTQLSVLRMVPIARRIASAGRGHLAVFRLLNSVRGWDTHHTPVDDAAWALERIEDELGGLPVTLVGHSLGGRAAILAGNSTTVRSVCALAPWVYPADGEAGLAGRPVMIVHGDRDRIARPDRSRAVGDRLAASTTVTYVTVTGGKHAMLRRHSVFDGLAAEFARWSLLGDAPRPELREALARGNNLTV